MSAKMESANVPRVVATALVFAFTVLAVLVNPASPRILRVPDPFPTIQAGLDSAGVGDTVLVDPGVYYENLVWPATQGVDLFANEEPPPLGTVIDGGFTFHPVITIAVPVDSTTEIRGFVIRHGAYDNGAGVYCIGQPAMSSPTIRGNRFEANSAVNFGGAICCQASSPWILGNTFHGNSATYGGALALVDGSSAVIRGNAMDSCFADQGGGIYATDNPLIRANSISECEATGAALFLAGPAVVDSNQITSNRGGSAVYCAASASLDGNAITGNSDTGVLVVQGFPVLQHNDIGFNRDGVVVRSPQVCTVSLNQLHHNSRHGISVELGAPLIERNQIMFNQGRGIEACTHSSTVRFNNISSNYSGGVYT